MFSDSDHIEELFKKFKLLAKLFGKAFTGKKRVIISFHNRRGKS